MSPRYLSYNLRNWTAQINFSWVRFMTCALGTWGDRDSQGRSYSLDESGIGPKSFELFLSKEFVEL